ncbi:MAG TPA: helix-turn-helix transcriptional regulator [Bryobacteraceae bacterium]|jgi:transcriptional regulator with XRE-family HTH domain
MISKQLEKLSNADYRKAFVAAQVNIGIPFQLRALMKARGWTQDQLAARTGMLQPRISAMLKPGKVRPNIETLRRFAEAFDCGLIVRFAPFSELVKWSDEFNPDSFDAPSFADDTGLDESEQTDIKPQEKIAARRLPTLRELAGQTKVGEIPDWEFRLKMAEQAMLFQYKDYKLGTLKEMAGAGIPKSSDPYNGLRLVPLRPGRIQAVNQESEAA